MPMFKLTPAREKELEKIAKDLPDKSFKDLYGKNWKSVKIATAMNILKKKYGYKTEETMKTFKQIRERYRGKYPPSMVAKAVEIALSMGGNMTGAYKKIEKMKRGLGDDPIVSDALRKANEAVQEESNTNVREGTWAIPETKAELKKLIELLANPFPATRPAQIEKFIKQIPVGDDELYDDLEEHMYEKEGDDLKRPLKKVSSFDKIFLNVVAGESLNGRWLKGKTQGNKFIATHHYFDGIFEKAMKRKSGKFRPKRMQRIEL